MNVFFEPVNINQWNMFELVSGIGHIEPFLATSSMQLNDLVVLHIGQQNKQYKSGIYAYGTIVKGPYILRNRPTDYCNNKNTVDVKIDYISYDDPLISHEDSKTFTKQFRTVHKINDDLAKLLIVELEKQSDSFAYSDSELIEQLTGISRTNEFFEYSDTLKLKPSCNMINNVKVFPRNKKTCINALNHAGYKCEIAFEHRCFLRKDGKTPYTEAHHLIPMAYQDEFEYSLDIEENIISLCSNCHNEIHYGNNANQIITKLYYERIELLEKKKIYISLEKLLEYYGY